MAGKGAQPKESHTRARADVAFDAIPVESDVLYGKPLPEGVLPGGEDWHEQTLALWESLRRSPMLANEPEMGWQFLIDTALMHHTMWAKGRWEFASEVRLRVAKFGATPEDRMRLKIKIQAGPTVTSVDAPQAVTNIHSRRSRLA